MNNQRLLTILSLVLRFDIIFPFLINLQKVPAIILSIVFLLIGIILEIHYKKYVNKNLKSCLLFWLRWTMLNAFAFLMVLSIWGNFTYKNKEDILIDYRKFTAVIILVFASYFCLLTIRFGTTLIIKSIQKPSLKS